MRTIYAMGVLGLGLVSCARFPNAKWEGRYQHPKLPYAVNYLGGSSKAFIGPDWMLDNFRVGDGDPVGPKTGPGYLTTRSYDYNDDGEFETTHEEVFYDLLFIHRRTDARIALQSIPVATKFEHRELGVMARRWVESVSGTEEVLVEWGPRGPIGAVSQHFTARTLGERPCSIDRHEAYAIEYEIADVDELRLNPLGRWRRVRLVLIRTPYRYKLYGEPKLPIFLAATFAASPVDFQSLEPSFEQFLGLIALGDEEHAPTTPSAPNTCAGQLNAPSRPRDSMPLPEPGNPQVPTPTLGPEERPTE